MADTIYTTFRLILTSHAIHKPVHTYIYVRAPHFIRDEQGVKNNVAIGKEKKLFPDVSGWREEIKKFAITRTIFVTITYSRYMHDVIKS